MGHDQPYRHRFPEVLALRRELQRVAELMQVPPVVQQKSVEKDVHKEVGKFQL